MPPFSLQTRPASAHDLAGILELQDRNLYAHLDEAQRQQGFVTTAFTEAQLLTLLEQRGIFVALADDQVIGYALAGSWEFFSQWPIFPFMQARLPALQFQAQEITVANSFQYGPVCVDAAFRGKAVFPQLFECMRLSLCQRYPIGVTFINRLNTHSYHAHTKKLGMQVIDTFEFNERPYYGLAFEMQRSVIDN